MAPRGIRNHNPGNIKAGDPWVGAVGSDGRFAIFDRPEHGIRALAKILLGYRTRHGLRTIREYIGRWAPPSENNTPAYVAAVCATCNVGPDDDYPLTAESLPPLVAAIIWHENGQQPYPPETIAAGVDMALGRASNPANSPRNVDAAPIVDADPAHRIEIEPSEPSMPIPLAASVALSVVPELIKMIPVIGSFFGTGTEVSNRNIAVAQTVADTITKVVPNAVNVVDAVQKMQADDTVRKEATAAFLSAPPIVQLMEVGGGIDAARKANAAMQGDRPAWHNPAVWMTGLFMTLPAMLMVDVFYVHPPLYSGELRTQIVTAVLTVVSIVGAYWFGTTRGSERKTELSAQQSRVL